MRAICVDDEINVLRGTVALSRRLPQLDEVKGFTSAEEALVWLGNNHADLALLDVDMPGFNGLDLARVIQEKYPDTAIIFLTGYPQFAVEAFALHVSGYLLKPIGRDALAKEVDHALEDKIEPAPRHIVAETFGSFNFLVDGKNIGFGRAKAKELMAYLVDRRGGAVTRPQIVATLWEDRPYERSIQKQMDVLIRSIRATLQEYGIADLLVVETGTIRIRPELLECDYYRFLNGDAAAIRAFDGEYMSAYPWGEETAGKLTMMKMDYDERIIGGL